MSQTQPNYLDMVVEAVVSLNKYKGSSRQAIVKYMMKNFSLSDNSKTVNGQVSKVILAALDDKILIQMSGTGAKGSYEVNAEYRKRLTAKGLLSKKASTPKTRSVTLNKDVTSKITKAISPKAKTTTSKMIKNELL
ncbi:Histone H1-delta [Aphelenchoides besseyi]|nr:Histone H1-delta [Aphelenchoides besseyi]